MYKEILPKEISNQLLIITGHHVVEVLLMQTIEINNVVCINHLEQVDQGLKLYTLTHINHNTCFHFPINCSYQPHHRMISHF